VAIPDFVVALRTKVGTDLLWMTGVTAVVLRDGVDSGREVLLIRRSDNGDWTPITGIIDPGEEPAVAAAREILEEAAVTATVERLAWVHSLPPMRYSNGDRAQYLDLTFTCRYVAGDPAPDDDETVAAAWFDLERLPVMNSDMAERIAVAASAGPATRFET
jgi:8-oxo-dGTP pyrophosphatase MutT (NUDIX family)